MYKYSSYGYFYANPFKRVWLVFNKKYLVSNTWVATLTTVGTSTFLNSTAGLAVRNSHTQKKATTDPRPRMKSSRRGASTGVAKHFIFSFFGKLILKIDLKMSEKMFTRTVGCDGGIRSRKFHTDSVSK